MGGARFVRARELTLKLKASGRDSDELRERVASHWADRLSHNPRLFNGKLISPISVSISEGSAAVEVRRSDYAHYLYARSTSGVEREEIPGTIFVSLIVPVSGSRFIVGKMAPHTAAPGIVQLPGGGVTDLADLRVTVIEEAAEELGLTIDPKDLQLTGLIIRDGLLDVGAVYKTRTHDRSELNSAFKARLTKDQLEGKLSEFVQLFEVDINAGQGWMDELGETVDYLEDVVRVLREDGLE